MRLWDSKAAATLGVAAVIAAGCGRSESEPASVPAPPPADEASAVEPQAARRVDPRRGGLEVAMGEWAVQLEAETIRPGPVTFVVSNRGKVAHGFEIELDEDSSGHGGDDDRHKVESRVLAPGDTIRLRLDLPPGIYKVECLVDGHDDLGMETLLEVGAGAPLVKEEAAREKQTAVAISGFAFRPAKLTIQAGQTVTWTNDDPADHTVTQQGGGFTSKTFGPKGRFRLVFDRPGTYRYFCAVHPEMRGTVVVRG